MNDWLLHYFHHLCLLLIIECLDSQILVWLVQIQCDETAWLVYLARRSGWNGVIFFYDGVERSHHKRPIIVYAQFRQTHRFCFCHYVCSSVSWYSIRLFRSFCKYSSWINVNREALSTSDRKSPLLFKYHMIINFLIYQFWTNQLIMNFLFRVFDDWAAMHIDILLGINSSIKNISSDIKWILLRLNWDD